ncbi:ARMT1-like domain-containing protein [Clostridium sp. C2-6-12]|uniref:damage-control phosphatase ARMT1 family protein n=1 Tax=Clostridium sp. C2-6-12 TaxID=2698832 RepID=UPI00136D3783|nr:ARMT1-like domain-containing protein [Clostridium sp. C2-6-12]
MKMRDKCLPCVVNQVIKTANITGVDKKEELLREVFTYLSKMNFNITTPEIIGEVFGMIKKHVGNPDPYKETRNHYNTMFLKLLPEFEKKVDEAEDSFQLAVRYAIVGNIIDFNPIHNTLLEDIFDCFEKMDDSELEINDSKALKEDILSAKTLLYLGDNCGEICLDKILLKKIKELNPKVKIFFGVRGKSVVNDSIAEDAYAVGIDEYAEIIDNGDGSLGTVLNRTSSQFKEVYNKADVLIAKGQANYECLSEENKNIYFLLMTKCDVIANDIGVPEKKMICMKNKVK